VSKLNGHTIKFKTPEGAWVDIPLAIIDVYNVYQQYCTEHNIEPVTVDTYYNTLGNLATYVEQLGNSTNAIESLKEALDSGTLSTTMGGTGKAFDSFNALVTELHTKLSQNEVTGFVSKSELEDDLAQLDYQKLDSAKIGWGTNKNQASATCQIFFEYTN
jgi:hypothetical protein